MGKKKIILVRELGFLKGLMGNVNLINKSNMICKKKKTIIKLELQWMYYEKDFFIHGASVGSYLLLLVLEIQNIPGAIFPPKWPIFEG